jgi:hypothetical protein
LKVKFASDVLSHEPCYRVLDRIVELFMDGRHMWDLDDFDVVAESPWIRSESNSRTSKGNREAMEKCYTGMAYQAQHMHTRLVIVTNNPNGVAELSPLNARRYLETPAFVLVENSESDGFCFLDAMIYCFFQRQLQDAQTEGWWLYEHLGGYGEVEKRLDQLLARTVGPSRIFVIADSDRLYPGHVSSTETKVRRACEERGISFKILNKRKIENYIPPSLLGYARRKQKTLRAFMKLTQGQKDFYEMKKGFESEDSGEDNVPRQRIALYADVGTHVRRDLRGGFGPKVCELLKTKRALLKSEDVKKICPNDPNEIDLILDEVKKIL